MTSLDRLIADLRDELRAEAWGASRLHVRDGEAFDEHGKRVKVRIRTNGHAATWTGMPFSNPFGRLLGPPDGWGSVYLARASVQEVSEHCHARHMNHMQPGNRYSLCASLVFRVVELQQPVGHAAAMLELEPERAGELLETMLLHAEVWRTRRLDDLRKAAQVEKAAEVTVQEQMRADHDSTDWERQKWDALKEDYHLPPWEIEWERRLAQHAKYGCSRCERIAA